MTEMKKALAITKELRLKQFKEHREKHRGMNVIKGFSQTEWNQQETGMKKSYGAKAKKHSHNALWRHYDQKVETL
tara:strand:- start:51 stop:275 length:225 start_codon:yes stop_codon:yes gene_type:complete